jgi:hypothetical protein
MLSRRASARSPAAASSDARETSSPLFQSLIERMDQDSRYEILDLGPATPENIDFFGRSHCRLNIADCLTDLVTLPFGEDTSDTQLQARVRGMLPPHADRRFDIVLAWDVLNYLDQSVLRALVRDLADSIDHRTQLHAYVYPRQSMPERPSRFRIYADGRLVIQPGGPGQRPSPCYLQPQLEKLMPALVVQRSVLLKNGIQEYLFRGR